MASAKKEFINTSVDKLVSLVNEVGRISFKDAAKKLAIPMTSVEEWAHFLEEEDIVEIDYRFITPFLVKKQLTAEQKKQKVESFKQEKNIFNNKLEAASSYFNELDKKILTVRQMMDDMEGNLSAKIKEVEHEVKELSKAEQEKESIDRQIIESKKRAFEKIKEIESHIQAEKLSYRKSFEATKAELLKDQELLQKSQGFLHKVTSEENYLQQRLQEVRAMSAKIQQEVEMRSKMLQDTEKHMAEVQNKHDALRKDLEDEQNKLRKMIQENEEQEALIAKLQNTIFEKMTEGEKRIAAKQKEIKDIPARFQQMLQHKQEINDLLSTVSHEELELKNQIDKLRVQSKMLEMSLGSKDYEKEMEKLHKDIDAITSKRMFFKEKVEKLIKLLDWK